MKIKQTQLIAGLAFVSGMVLMVFELVAARLLAPTIGSSTYVWTSVIGVIIAMLALGVWLGGRLADKRGQLADIAMLLLAAAGAVVLVLLVAVPFLEGLAQFSFDPRIKGVVASILLFAPTSFVLGMIGPYLAKLQVYSLKHTGRLIASIDAMNALGGIFGTFMTGFVLFAIMGSSHILTALVIVLVAISWVVSPGSLFKVRVVLSLSIVIIALTSSLVQRDMHIDTATAHYVVADSKTPRGQTIRLISTGPGGYQSGIDIAQPDSLLFWYTEEIASVVDQLEQRDRILILGGGTYTLPRYLANKYPSSQVDVVEIDPALVDIARKYFFFQPVDNLQIISEDARVYVDTTSQKYDIVVVDVYSDSEVPFSVLTKQYGQSIRRIVQSGGRVIANIIASESKQCQDFLQASFRPYHDNFAIGIFRPYLRTGELSNIVAVFGDSKASFGADYVPVPAASGPVYTDDFAPAEVLQFRCAN